MIDRAALGLDNEPDHTHPFQIPGMADLLQLARALGGGSYPGLGSGQNNTMPQTDSVAPGFPLNLPFLVDANTVKQQAVTLTFQPQAYRTYISTATHSHPGDTVQTLSIDHQHATVAEAQGHKHRWFQTSGQVTTSPTTTPPNLGKWLEGKVYGIAGNWVNNGNLAALDNDDANLHTDDLYTETDAAQSSNHDHGNVNVTSNTTLTSHTHTPGTTGGTTTPTGVQEGTSPDAMHVLVDGTDVTTQLGGPFTTPKTELDITPYVAPGTGLHMVQVTTATNLGRIAGFVGLKSIVNNMATM